MQGIELIPELLGTGIKSLCVGIVFGGIILGVVLVLAGAVAWIDEEV